MRISAWTLFLGFTFAFSPSFSSSQSVAPSNWIIESTGSDVVPAVATHRVILPATTAVPAKGQPFIEPTTGHRITRISDVGDQANVNGAYNGDPAAGYTNGYSKYSAVNVTGEYALAFGTTGSVLGVYDLRTCQNRSMAKILTRDGRILGNGELYDPRWDLSNRPGTQYTLMYQVMGCLMRYDVLQDTHTLIYDFGVGTQIAAEGHYDQDANGRYRSLAISGQGGRVVDMIEKKLLPVQFPWAADVSPSGTWFNLAGTFHHVDDVLAGDATKGVKAPVTNFGHDGWAYDYNGDEVWLAQDNGSDWWFAYNPKTRVRTNIFHMTEPGWTFNMHMGRMINPAKKGWFMLASYGTDNAIWSNNQLMMIEVLPAARKPRIWRIAPNYTLWGLGTKDATYFQEAFASLSPDGNSILWGCNWRGQDNLELYRVELPPNWEQVLAGSNMGGPNNSAQNWARYE